MQMIAQSWLVYRLTGSSFLLGAIGFASQIPIFLLAFVGGTIADRYNRHRVVIATQAASMILALTLSVLTLTGTVRIWHIFVLSALLGVVNAFDMPTRQAFIVELVEREDLMNAIALNSSIFNGARVMGPAVAGIVIAGIGEGWCFFANGISYVAVIAGLLLMKLKAQSGTNRKESAISNVLEGFHFVRRTRPIRALLLLLGLLSIVGMPYSVLMPIFADKILHGGPRGLGILMGATGFGALIGSISLAAKSGTRGLGKLIAYASTGFGAGLLLFSISRYFWLSAIFLVPVGIVLHDDHGLHQYADPDHGPGSLARPRHGDARVDVFGDDAVRFFYGRSDCDARRGAGDDVCGSSFMSGRSRAVCIPVEGAAADIPWFDPDSHGRIRIHVSPE